MQDARKTVRDLYNRACHGAGAAERWTARDALDAIAAAVPSDAYPIKTGHNPTAAMLEDQGLDLAAFFASRPISR